MATVQAPIIDRREIHDKGPFGLQGFRGVVVVTPEAAAGDAAACSPNGLFHGRPAARRGLNGGRGGYPLPWERPESGGAVAKVAPRAERLPAHCGSAWGSDAKGSTIPAGMAGSCSPQGNAVDKTLSYI